MHSWKMIGTLSNFYEKLENDLYHGNFFLPNNDRIRFHGNHVPIKNGKTLPVDILLQVHGTFL